MFYSVTEDPKSLLTGYALAGIAPIDRRSPTNWTKIFFAADKQGVPYVIRLTNTATTSIKERLLEHAIAVKLSEQEIGPRIYASFPEEGVLLMEKLQPAVLDPHNMLQVERLAQLIARLHAINTNELPDMPKVADKYATAKDELELLFAATQRFPQHSKAYADWWQLRERLEGNVIAPVLCHNDIHVRNLMTHQSGSLALIDNDHSSLGSGLFDLAAVVISLKLPAAVEQSFLRAYGTRVDDTTFLEYKKLVYLTYACMVFSFIENPEHIDPGMVMDIDPSGGFGRLPQTMSRDMRLYIQSCSFLRVLGDLTIG